MIKRVTETKSKAEVLSTLDPLIAEWFDRKFVDLTEPQALAIPLIDGKQNVLVSSPTGSGKTLTAFLSIIDDLYKLQKAGRLENKIYAVYVSPLKALANDINKNLLAPISEISALAREKGEPELAIRVAVRTGDTSMSERQRQATRAPHIFITTPESLALVLSTPKFRLKFEGVEYAIVDEIHEVCDSKRGVALSLSLERLQMIVPQEIVRIGLSATQAPIEEIGKFLVGHGLHDWRDVTIAEVPGQKSLELRVLCPAEDMTALPFEIVNSKMYDLLTELIARHRTTLIFTNTRSGTEHVVFKLKERGVTDIEAHHGSMSKESRISVENDLKDGKLRAVVSSTSLELGIDIGYIDLVCQIGSPKTVAKALQRVGRSGHDYGKTSQGRLIVFDNDDLVECAVLCRAAHRKHVDRVSIPRGSLDVLAQTIVGMSLERKWHLDEAFQLVRRAYSYRDLTREQFEAVIRYLSSKEEHKGVYSKIWYDERDGVFGMKRGSRLIFYLNQGTIPEESSYKVLSEKGVAVGDLSEKFVERLSRGDIFVLGGRSYEFLRTRGMKAFVKNALGRKPTVPSWTGEMLPRSFDLSVEVGRFREEIASRLESCTEQDNQEWLQREFDIDEGSARTIINYLREQQAVAGIPTDSSLLVEGYRDEEGRCNIIFHLPFGRRVNDALSRAYAFQMSNRYGFNSTVSITDDCFSITIPRPVPLEDIPGLVKSDELEAILRRSLKDTELLKQRFRHVATRSLMILRNYRGRELSVSRQQTRAHRLLDLLGGLEDYPVVLESYNEILNEVFDLDHAREVLESIESGQRGMRFVGYAEAPSPFSHNVLLAGISDVVLMEDRSSLLRQLHRKVLTKILGTEVMAEYKFDDEKVKEHFVSKIRRVTSGDGLLELLRVTGPIRLFKERGLNASGLTGLPISRVRKLAAELLRDGKIRSVWLSDVHWAASEQRDMVSVALARDEPITERQRKLLELLESPKAASELAQESSLSKEEVVEMLHSLERRYLAERCSFSRNAFKWRASAPAYGDRDAAREELIAQHLALFAPRTLQEIAFHFRLGEPEVRRALEALESQGRTVSGRFVVGDDVQYMLVNDYVALSNEGQEVFDEETVRKYQVWKQFHGISSVDEYFERFGEAGMLYDIYQRVPALDLDSWSLSRSSGEILSGRFLRGKVRYVRVNDAPRFVSLYRSHLPSDFENAVLRKIDELDGATVFDLEREMGSPRERIKEALERLDLDVRVIRRYTEGEDWSGLNIYETFEPDRLMEDSAEWLVRKFVASRGPVSLSAIRSYTGLDVGQLLPIVQKLGLKKILTGLSAVELYALQEDVERLKEFRPTRDRMRILSLYDPILETRWAELTSRFGEGWYFPLFKDGTILGVTEIWPLSSCIEVRELALDDPIEEHLTEFLDALDDFARFFQFYGIDVVRIRALLGADAGELEDRFQRLLRTAGYALMNGMWVKGSVVDLSLTASDILSYVFSRQHLAPSKQYISTASALRSMGGLRSEFEGLVRSKRTDEGTPISKLSGVFKGVGIPPFTTYLTGRQAAIYRRALDAKLSEDHVTLLEVLRQNPPMVKDGIQEQSVLGPSATADILRDLYLKTAVVLDSRGRYRPVDDSVDLTVFDARKSVVRKAFEMFGIFSAEGLARYLRHSFGMRDLRRAMRELEEAGYLAKGYVRPGDDTLYWIVRSDLGRLGKIRFAGDFVLAPQDRLQSYLRDVWNLRYGETNQFLIFSQLDCCGRFRARFDRHAIEIRDFEGDGRAGEILRRLSQRIARTLHREDERRLSEWEIADFFEKTHLFVRE